MWHEAHIKYIYVILNTGAALPWFAQTYNVNIFFWRLKWPHCIPPSYLINIMNHTKPNDFKERLRSWGNNLNHQSNAVTTVKCITFRPFTHVKIAIPHTSKTVLFMQKRNLLLYYNFGCIFWYGKFCLFSPFSHFLILFSKHANSS